MLSREIKKIIKAALAEDIGSKDITTLLSLPRYIKGEAVIIAKETGVLCGIEIAAAVFKEADKRISFCCLKKDGSRLRNKERVAHIKGDVRSILTAERVAVNFLSLLSGISTATAQFVDKAGPCSVKILDTRKTTPGLRVLEKYAVRAGGGHNHRLNLETGVIVKDNHLRGGKFFINGSLDESKFDDLIKRLRRGTALKIEIEVENLLEFRSVMKYNPDVIMLDNFPAAAIKKAVDFRNKHYPGILIEASGGVNLKNVREIASCGVDFISVGNITHSAKALDFSLEII